MIPYYAAQITPSACSVASLAMVFNAARSRFSLAQDDMLIDQEILLKRVKTAKWADKAQAGGVYIEDFQAIARSACKEFRFKKVEVKIVWVLSDRKERRDRVIKDLTQLEDNAGFFMIANFDQKSFTDDTSVGHYAPVAAYDRKRKRVLILDPDREWYEPYWVSVESFMSGMIENERGYLKLAFRA